MATADVLIFGLKLSVIGMVIVFLVLSSIAGVVSLMRKMDRRWEEREKAESAAALARPPTLDDLTLVLISAAVATMAAGRYRIRSVRRIQPTAPGSSSWSLQGRSTLHGSHILPKY